MFRLIYDGDKFPEEHHWRVTELGWSNNANYNRWSETRALNEWTWYGRGRHTVYTRLYCILNNKGQSDAVSLAM